jgi:lipid-binding SYLF domain-containing protein
MLKKKLLILLTLSLMALSLDARSNAAQKEEQAENRRYNKTIRTFMAEDKKIKNLVFNSFVYIAFPSIGKGGFILGGAYGNGRAYKRGMWIGDVTLTQYTIGLQAGGQSYSEMIFFKTEKAFKDFLENGLKSGTQSSVIGGTASASGDMTVAKDVYVYTIGNGGLMLEATTGAQDFDYVSREHR